MDPLTDPVVFTAGPTFLGVLFVASSLLAYFLFRRDQPGLERNDEPNTASTRGTYIPLVIGRRRTGAVVLWVGQRSTEDRTEGGKGGGQQTRIYFEQGIHALCVGPAHEINNIWVDGEQILPDGMVLNISTIPNGGTVTIDGHGTFRIYWGEFGADPDPDIDPIVSDKWGIDTKLPACCMVIWDKKELGPSPRWPTIEYEVTVLPTVAGIFTDPSWVQDTTDLYGVNPSWALYQLLTGPYPYGAGLPVAWIDTQSLWDVHFACGADQLSMNLLINDGRTVDEVIGDILQDIGCFMVECEGKLAFHMIRKDDSPEIITLDMVEQPRTRTKKIHIGENQRDQLIFSYKDANKQYSDGVIKREDDSRRNALQRPNDLKVQVITMTSRHSVARLANRRELEEFGEKKSLTIRGLRNLRYLKPGVVLRAGQIADGFGDVRVVSVQPEYEDSMSVLIECISDTYATAEPVDYVDPDLVVEETIALQPDTRWDPYESPYWLSPTQVTFFVPRVPSSEDVLAGRIWISSDNITFTLIGEQPNAVGGVITESWGNPTDRPVTPVGPIITIDSTSDISLLQDLTNDTQGWLNGKQAMVSRTPSGDEEIMFVKKFEFTGTANQYRALDVIRARFDSGMDEHLTGDNAFVVRATSLTLLPHAPATGGQTWYFKSQPFSGVASAPLDSIASKPLQVQGNANAPVGPVWVGCGIRGQWNNLIPKAAGDTLFDVALEIRAAFSRTDTQGLAGQNAFGTSSISVPTSPSGFFFVEIYDASVGGGSTPTRVSTMAAADGTGLLRYDVNILSDGSTDLLAYAPSANIGVVGGLVNGSPSTWWIEVYELSGGIESPRTVIYPEWI